MNISQFITWLLGAKFITDSVLHFLQYAGKFTSFVSFLTNCILGFLQLGHSIQYFVSIYIPTGYYTTLEIITQIIVSYILSIDAISL